MIAVNKDDVKKSKIIDVNFSGAPKIEMSFDKDMLKKYRINVKKDEKDQSK